MNNINETKLISTNITEIKDQVETAINVREEAYLWLKNLADVGFPSKSNACLLEELKEEQKNHEMTRQQLQDELDKANAQIVVLKHKLSQQSQLNSQMIAMTRNKNSSPNLNQKNNKASLHDEFERLKMQIEKHSESQHFKELCDHIKSERDFITNIVEDSSTSSTQNQNSTNLSKSLEKSNFNNLSKTCENYPELKNILSNHKEFFNSNISDNLQNINNVCSFDNSFTNSKKEQILLSSETSFASIERPSFITDNDKPILNKDNLQTYGLTDVSKLIGLAKGVSKSMKQTSRPIGVKQSKFFDKYK